MPSAEYGEKISFSTSKFNKLKSKGDKIHFRLIGKPFYDGKHFMEDSSSESGWDVKDCPRINDGGECEVCEMFFAAHKSAKKENLDKKATEKLTRPFKAAVSFYFPVINRDTESFEVFQTTIGVRNQIEAERDLGTKVMERDLTVMRTEVPGNNYYKLKVIDSSETNDLTEKETSEFEVGKNTNLGDYINGQEEEGDVVEDMEV